MQIDGGISIDYLTIGHLTKDVLEEGTALGGTATYATLTADAYGLQAALVTAWDSPDLPEELCGIPAHIKLSASPTTFRNFETAKGRKQYIHHTAQTLTAEDIPEHFLGADILHLGPVAQEVDPAISLLFPDAFIGITPQGWMRKWNSSGLVSPCGWDPPEKLLSRADAVVFSVEDVSGDEDIISDLSHQTEVLAVTEGYLGARIYWHGDVRAFRAPPVTLVDATGAGDIFAAVFFIRLRETKDPWSSGELAVKVASNSVTRRGLNGIPSIHEIQSLMVETIKR